MLFPQNRRPIAVVQAACILFSALLLIITLTPLVPSLATYMAADWYEGSGDVLVVLGGSMLVSGTGPRATLGYDSYLRIVYADWVLKSAGYHLVVTSGANGLAENMAAYLIAHHVPASMILIENRSTSTHENATFTKELLARRNVLRPGLVMAVVTSDYHTWRAQKCFAKIGLPTRAIPVPDVAKRSGVVTFRWPGFFILLGEWAKDIVYRVSGRI